MPKMTILEYAETYLPLPIRLRYLSNAIKNPALKGDDLSTRKFEADLEIFGRGAFRTQDSPEGTLYWWNVGSQYKIKIKE